jgi:hypothetical protein
MRLPARYWPEDLVAHWRGCWVLDLAHAEE